MTIPAVRVEELSKEYLIGSLQHSHRTFYDLLTHLLRSPFSRRDQRSTRRQPESFWALRDVNFDLQAGEVMGIVGRNGAGKSTLLKILSRITAPTRGRVSIKGRVASLLEVGTGFHPELSGRENIFLNASILGMSRREVARKFDEIVAFAEVEKFLDTPVKRYSSGMYIRLAFAVAANLEPDVLLVDEVLAVGDAEFQKKCLGKMKEVSTGRGRAVVFVSHNMKAVSALCSRSLLLEHGRVAELGRTEDIVSRYLQGNALRPTIRVWDRVFGDSDIQLKQIELKSADPAAPGKFRTSDAIVLEMQYEVMIATRNVRLGFRLQSADGSVIFTSEDTDTFPELQRRAPGAYRTWTTIPGEFLNEGVYTITVTCHEPMVRIVFVEENCLSFQVVHADGVGGNVDDQRQGFIRPRLAWQYTRLP
jgi:lipopolysaccharide transport system ATP-binding protein